MPKKNEVEHADVRFSKEQIVSSNIFCKHADLLDACLSKDQPYTVGEVKDIIEKYKKGKVK